VQRPVLILGSLDGVETGVRNLARRVPLEVEVHATPHGPIQVPTLPEITRITAWLVLVRNATRDYVDLVALADRIGPPAADVLLSMDDFYAVQPGAGGQRIAMQVARQLAEPLPYDFSDVDLRHDRRLEARWRHWSTVADACRSLAVAVMDRIAEESSS
jgi:hypothetical protein